MLYVLQTILSTEARTFPRGQKCNSLSISPRRRGDEDRGLLCSLCEGQHRRLNHLTRGRASRLHRAVSSSLIMNSQQICKTAVVAKKPLPCLWPGCSACKQSATIRESDRWTCGAGQRCTALDMAGTRVAIVNSVHLSFQPMTVLSRVKGWGWGGGGTECNSCSWSPSVIHMSGTPTERWCT